MNTTDIKSKNLEDAYKEWASLNKEGEMNGSDFRLIQAGANWQKEQDKVIIDKLIKALGFMCKVASAKCQFEKGKKIELKFESDTLRTWVLNTKELLNSLK